MYPSDLKFEVDVPPEVLAYRQDIESLGVICDMEHWYVTESWAKKFQEHLRLLLPLAERGNILAQHSVAVIHMTGCCYADQETCESNWPMDSLEMTRWLVCSARQGYMCALDNLTSTGVGPEAELARSVHREIAAEMKEGKTFPRGETLRRLYGGEHAL